MRTTITSLAFIFIVSAINNSCTEPNRDHTNEAKESKTHLVPKKNATPNVDSILFVDTTVLVNIDTLKKDSFSLVARSRLLPISNGRIIVQDIINEEDYATVFNPFKKISVDTIHFDNYRLPLVEHSGHGVGSESIFFLRNNKGVVKVLCTDAWGEFPDFSLSNLYPINQPKTRIILQNHQETKMKDFDEVFFNEEEQLETGDYRDILVANDSLYQWIDISESNEKISLFFKCISKIEAGIILSTSFPINNKMFLVVGAGETSILYSYSILTGVTTKYILPVLTNGVYFSDTGFYLDFTSSLFSSQELMEAEENFRPKPRTYGFVKYL